MAPELLPFQHKLIDSVKNQIRRQEEEIKILSNIEKHADDRFYLNILKMELERVKFIFKSYLRARLHKIEKYCLYIVEKDCSALVSASEQEFAFAMYQSRLNHFRESFLNKVPPKSSHFTMQEDEDIPDQMCKCFLNLTKWMFVCSDWTKLKGICVCEDD